MLMDQCSELMEEASVRACICVELIMSIGVPAIIHREHVISLHISTKRNSFWNRGWAQWGFYVPSTNLTFLCTPTSAHMHLECSRMLPISIHWYKHLWAWSMCTCILLFQSAMVHKKPWVIPHMCTVQCTLVLTTHSRAKDHGTRVFILVVVESPLFFLPPACLLFLRSFTASSRIMPCQLYFVWEVCS